MFRTEKLIDTYSLIGLAFIIVYLFCMFDAAGGSLPEYCRGYASYIPGLAAGLLMMFNVGPLPADRYDYNKNRITNICLIFYFALALQLAIIAYERYDSGIIDTYNGVLTAVAFIQMLTILSLMSLNPILERLRQPVLIITSLSFLVLSLLSVIYCYINGDSQSSASYGNGMNIIKLIIPVLCAIIFVSVLKESENISYNLKEVLPKISLSFGWRSAAPTIISGFLISLVFYLLLSQIINPVLVSMVSEDELVYPIAGLSYFSILIGWLVGFFYSSYNAYYQKNFGMDESFNIAKTGLIGSIAGLSLSVISIIASVSWIALICITITFVAAYAIKNVKH